jgi:dihydroorotase
MANYIIRNAQLVNEGKIFNADVLIKNDRIERIDTGLGVNFNAEEIDAEGLFLIPGLIDDQVHFREPGLTHKASIATEAKAAVAGGVTSFMEMPNVNPATLTQQLLEEKYKIASNVSAANFSFYMGVSNDNYDEVMQTPLNTVCGLKIFMGSSTGNMLVDKHDILERVFASAQHLIATHCEHEPTVRERKAEFEYLYGDKLNASFHPIIRNEDVCFRSSKEAVELAKKHNTRLHILHITTAEELILFTNSIPLAEKRITAEVCVHHLWFDADDYAQLGNKIKCNPAIKDKRHKPELLKALLDNRIDVIATDHAPHTAEEKALHYNQAPAGLPLVQHSLNVLLQMYHDGKLSLEKIVEKSSHAVADCFKVKERGYLREGYFADAVLVDLNKEWVVSKENILYKCGWSPFEGKTFKGQVQKTFVNGNLSFNNGRLIEQPFGKRLEFTHRL